MNFNWIRAVEGSVVTALISSLTVLDPLMNGQPFQARTVATAFGATFLVGAIKGIGQTFQQANMVSTTIVQPANSTALTETVASPTSTKEA